MAEQFKLSEGRTLDYAVAGASNGLPLLWFHGTPSAYPPVTKLATTCEKKGIQLISYSRPGYGGSTRQKGRRVVDGVEDAKELLQYLGHDRFFVGGWSGGGKSSLACSCAARRIQADVVVQDRTLLPAQRSCLGV